MEYFIIVFSIFMLFYLTILNIIDKYNIKIIHPITIAILFGIIIGIFFIKKDIKIKFNDTIFFFIILPVIIMNAAKQIDLRNIFKNKIIILFFGFIGTLITFILLFTFIIFFKYIGNIDRINHHDGLVLSASLSATDSISILSIINAQQFSNLHTIIFGESIINDAVALVLFKSTIINKEYFVNSNNYVNSLVMIIGKFMGIFLLSIILGFLFGLLLLLYFYYFKNLQNHNKILIYLILGILSFGIGEYLDLSGILIIITYVIFSDFYLSKKSEFKHSAEGINIILETSSYICEYFCMIYVGICTIILLYLNYIKGEVNIVYSISCLISLFIVRWAVVGIPIIIANIYSDVDLTFRDVIVIWYSGLIKGSVSFALTLSSHFPDKNELKSIVLIIVLLTSFFLSSYGNILLKKLGFFDTKNDYPNANNFLNFLIYNKKGKKNNDTTSSLHKSLDNIDKKITTTLIL